MENEIFPQYLDIVKSTQRYYGTLKKKGDSWLIEAEPQVMELIRRVFHATDMDNPGQAMIPINKRTNGELNWFMIRYPLRIRSRKEWEQSLKETKEYILRRNIINQKPDTFTIDSKFKGKLLDFQKQGVSFIYHNERCLLADEMGLGKTVEALAMISKLKKSPVLIVAPSHLLSQWESETKRFLGEEIKIHIIKGLTPYSLPESNIYFIHYLLMRAWYDELIAMDFDVIILDEVQELRHWGTKKYKSFQILIEKTSSTYVIGLSGTPIYNYGTEMYNVLDIIDKNCLGNRRYFVKEWCERDYSYMIEKPEVFGKYLNDEGLLLRRRKEEVLKELPAKRRVINAVRKDDKLFIELATPSMKLAKEIPFIPDKEIGAIFLNITMGIRRASGVAKAQNVAEFVKLLLDSKEPCLLFAHHHLVINLYLKYLKNYNPLCVTGRETKEQKQKNVDSFMKGETDLLIINLRTTSGLNLQRARCVVFGELDWSPAVHQQAEDRVHRIGQKDSVMCYYLVADTPSDIEISECLNLKKLQFRGIMQDKEETKKEKLISQVEAQKFMWNIVNRLIDEEDNI